MSVFIEFDKKETSEAATNPGSFFLSQILRNIRTFQCFNIPSIHFLFIVLVAFSYTVPGLSVC